MRKKIKVLLLVKNLYAGTGTFAFQMLKLQNCEVALCVLDSKKRKLPNGLKGKVHYPNKNFSYSNFYGINPFLFFHLISELKNTLRLIEQEKPEIIIGIDLHCNLLIGIADIMSNAKFRTIFTCHNNLEAVMQRKTSRVLKPFLIVVAKYFYERADFVVCVSNGVGKSVKRIFSLKKPTIIYYGLNPKTVTNHKLSFSQSQSKKIISIGRFDAQKDFNTLIRAFSLVKKQFPLVELFLIGDGEQKKALGALVLAHELESSVHLLGWKEDIYPYLKNSDLFVLSSHYEGFGYVLLEAMSQGLPIVSTNTPFGPSEVLENGKYGALVPIGNTKILASEMLKVIKSKKIRLFYQKKSFERLKFFSEKKMLGSYESLIKALSIDKKGKSAKIKL